MSTSNVMPWRLLFAASIGVFAATATGSTRAPLTARAEAPTAVRGVIMGLNSSVASIGWLTAALFGGWLYAGVGFGGFGPLMAMMCFAAAAIVVPDSRMRVRLPG